MITLFLNGGCNTIPIPVIDILRSAPSLLVDGSNNDVMHHATYLLRLLTCGKQHAEIKEGSEIKQSNLYFISLLFRLPMVGTAEKWRYLRGELR